MDHHAVMVEADARNTQAPGRGMSPGLGVGDHDVWRESPQAVSKCSHARTAGHELPEQREIVPEGVQRRPAPSVVEVTHRGDPFDVAALPERSEGIAAGVHLNVMMTRQVR